MKTIENNQIAFAFKNIASSQLVYSCVSSINNWLYGDPTMPISIFYEEAVRPCVNLMCARYNIGESIFFTGSLIYTSFNLMKSTYFANRCKKYYYINDIEYSRSWFSKDDLPLFKKTIEDDKIVKFFRSEDHYNQFVKDGYNVKKIIVPDFDINSIVEVINDSK